MSVHPKRVCLLALAALAAALMSACQDDAAQAGVENTACDGDADCATGVCQFGVCVASDEDTSYTVALSVVPPDFRPDLVPQQTTGIEVGAGRQLPDFRLSTPVLLSGFISYDDGVPVEGDVRFRAVNGVDGRRFVATAHTEAGGGVITATVPPGRYDVTVIPSRTDVPRTVLRDQLISTEAPDDCPGNPEVHCDFLQFVVPSAQRYVALRGVVQRREPRIVPVVGARVYATSPDGAVESTTATTGDDGAFLVFMDPAADSVAFRVRAGDDASLPAYDFVPVTLPDDDDVDSVEVVLSLGEWTEPTPWTVRLATPDGESVMDALVTLVGERTPETEVDPLGVPIEHVTRTRTLGDDDAISPGVFEVDLAAGTWTITAADLGGRYGPAGPVVVDVADTSDATDVALRERRTVVGRVISQADGTGVRDAQVELALRSIDGADVEAFGLASSMVGTTPVTDDEGRFQAALPPGRFVATVIPGESSGLPRFVTELDLEDSDTAIITVPAAGVTQGRVLDRDGVPLAGATVEAWTDDGEPRLLARGVSDAEGTYRLLLPLDPP